MRFTVSYFSLYIFILQTSNQKLAKGMCILVKILQMSRTHMFEWKGEIAYISLSHAGFREIYAFMAKL